MCLRYDIKMKKLIGLLLILMCTGCSSRTEQVVTLNIDSRILMHERDNYTFFVHFESTQEVGQLNIRSDQNSTKILTDLKEGEPDRIQYKCRCDHHIPEKFSVWSTGAESLVIHLHSLTEVNGAGWNHGKFGSGQTTVIE